MRSGPIQRSRTGGQAAARPDCPGPAPKREVGRKAGTVRDSGEAGRTGERGDRAAIETRRPPGTNRKEHRMAELKLGGACPEALQGKAGRRARVANIPAVGEVLDEQALRLVAGGDLLPAGAGSSPAAAS